MARQNVDSGRGRARAKAWAPGIEGARPPAGLLVPDGLTGTANWLRGLLSQWILAEVAPGRLLPWLPVAFGVGIAVYFAAAREPAWWASVFVASGTIAVAIKARRHAIAFPIAVAAAAAATGYATATLQTIRIAHPILRTSLSTVALAGFVEMREERERSDRITMRVERFDELNGAPIPTRVRIAVRKGSAPAVGSFVDLKAHLSPPLQPLRPGGYDFARDMYFQQIGASGYALGKIKTMPAQKAKGAWLHYAAVIDGVRESIDRRIRSVIPGDDGSIASALITGKRDAISAPVNDAMYVSSLAHVLSISGYHMAVVAGIVFFVFRAALALVPSFASRYPIKKWAAMAALFAATFYLMLSGAEVATQRSYIMIAIVLLGVIFDRPTLTFRTISVAAVTVLALAPQAIVHPSFQMSFAATLALIATYQHGLPWQAERDTSLGMRVALWGAREAASLLLASLVAGLATTPFAAYHFHRLAPYGILANLLAMPVVSVLVMPMGILGVLTMPLGFDDFFWRAMAHGIDWMNAVALWVTSIPGALGRIPAFETGPLLLATAALLLICLLRTPLRWAGAAVALVATILAVTTPRPDVFVAGDGQSVAFRGVNKQLSVLNSGRDVFAIKEWLASDADGRAPKDPSLTSGVACDAIGCVGRLSNGRLLAIAKSVEAIAEDCVRASLVIAQQDAPRSCAALVVDRDMWRNGGAIALRWNGTGFDQVASGSPGLDRPWTLQSKISSPTIKRSEKEPGESEPQSGELEIGD